MSVRTHLSVHSDLWKRESACQALKNDTSVSSWFGELGFLRFTKGYLGGLW